MTTAGDRRAPNELAGQSLQVGRRGRRRVPGRLRRLRHRPGSPHHAPVGTSALEAPPPPVLKAGTLAPAFSLPDLRGGDPVSLSAFRGRPVIVNFFASWCPDCRAELGAVAAVARATSGRVAVIGVDSNETSDAAATRLLAAAGATYPVAVDAQAKVATQYLVQALPVSYFLDAIGQGGRGGPRSPDRLLAGALGGTARGHADERVERDRGGQRRPAVTRRRRRSRPSRRPARSTGRPRWPRVRRGSRPSSSTGCSAWFWS